MEPEIDVKNSPLYSAWIHGSTVCLRLYSTCLHFRMHLFRQALLINSANLMGGSSEPDGYRGFGRIHLEAGMPLGGEGNLTLFVADANYTSIPELSGTSYTFDVDADAGLDFRATLCWIDPAAVTFSAIQLVNDLDLSVISPNGTTHTMWSSGATDAVNVNERVIVDSADVETGTWTVWVRSGRLSTDDQTYSLVVNGAISPGTGDGQGAGSTSTSLSDSTGSDESDSIGSSDSDESSSSSTSFSDSMESSSSDSQENSVSTSSTDSLESSSLASPGDSGAPSITSDSPISSDFEDSIEDAGTSGNSAPAVTSVALRLCALVLGFVSYAASAYGAQY